MVRVESSDQNQSRSSPRSTWIELTGSFVTGKSRAVTGHGEFSKSQKVFKSKIAKIHENQTEMKSKNKTKNWPIEKLCSAGKFKLLLSQNVASVASPVPGLFSIGYFPVAITSCYVRNTRTVLCDPNDTFRAHGGQSDALKAPPDFQHSQKLQTRPSNPGITLAGWSVTVKISRPK